MRRKILITSNANTRDDDGAIVEVVVMRPQGHGKPRDVGDIVRLAREAILRSDAVRISALLGDENGQDSDVAGPTVQIRSGLMVHAGGLDMESIDIVHMDPRAVLAALRVAFDAMDWISGESSGRFVAVGEW